MQSVYQLWGEMNEGIVGVPIPAIVNNLHTNGV